MGAIDEQEHQCKLESRMEKVEGSLSCYLKEGIELKAEFAAEFPEEFLDWKNNGNYMICLVVEDNAKLIKLYEELAARGVNVSNMYETDINEDTAIAFIQTQDTRELTKDLQLANSTAGTINKHNG